MNKYKTQRLTLRPVKQEDFSFVHSYASCYENIKYMIWGPSNETDTQNFINFAMEQWTKNPITNYQFAVDLTETRNMIGACNITTYDESEAEIGWLLHRDYWKHGYGTEMGEFLIQFGFSELNLRRIIAHCDADNYGSYRVMERNGMRREGCFIEGRPTNKMSGKQWSDEYSYAILKSEWKQMNSAK